MILHHVKIYEQFDPENFEDFSEEEIFGKPNLRPYDNILIYGKDGPEFKAGDVVVCDGYSQANGRIGTVVSYDEHGRFYSICFDENVRGHECDGRKNIPLGHGLFLPRVYLKKIKNVYEQHQEDQQETDDVVYRINGLYYNSDDNSMVGSKITDHDGKHYLIKKVGRVRKENLHRISYIAISHKEKNDVIFKKIPEKDEFFIFFCQKAPIITNPTEEDPWGEDSW